MKTLITFNSRKRESHEDCHFRSKSTGGFSGTKTFLLSFYVILLLFILPFTTFAQHVQQDLRLLTDAYKAGECPANDIQILATDLDAGNPCNTCTPGSTLSGNLSFTITNSTNTDRHLAVLGTLNQTIGGVTTSQEILSCFEVVKKDNEPAGGQILDFGQVDFICGADITFTNILLVWTAAAGECPVTLANNPNGKYCYAIPTIIVGQPFQAKAESSCSTTTEGKMNVALAITGGSGDFSYLWSDISTLKNRIDIPIGNYSVTIFDNLRKDSNGNPCKILLNVSAAVNCCITPNAGENGSTSVCESNVAVINLFDLITGEQAGGTWARTTGDGGTFNAAAGTYKPATGATSSTFTYTLTATAPCVDDSSVATVTIYPSVTAGTGSPGRYCIGAAGLASVDLDARLAGETAGGVWTNAANEVVASPINLSGFAAGAYTFKYTVTPTAQGSLCPPDDESVTITIDPSVTAGTGSPGRYCIGAAGLASVDLRALLTGEDDGGVWANESEEVVANPINLSGFASGSYEFKYTVTPTAQGSLCQPDVEWVIITIDPLPEIKCPDDFPGSVVCGVNAKTAQDLSDGEFDKWFDTFETLNSGITDIPASLEIIDVTYDYEPDSAKPDSGTAPLIPKVGVPSVNSTSVTVTWTIKNIETGCVNSCSATYSTEYTCVIRCEITEVINSKCNGDDTGSIKVKAAGGTLPYVIYLYKKPDLVNSIDQSGVLDTEPGEYTFSDLGPGEYLTESTDYVVKQGSGTPCEANITEPDALKLELTPMDETCIDSNTGSIKVTFSGGTAPYKLQLDNGNPFVATSPYTFENVSSDNHTVYIYDKNYADDPSSGCTDQKSVNVGTIPCGDELCTYTQGAYNNRIGQHCDGNTDGLTAPMMIAQSIVNAGGTITVGKTGSSVYITAAGVDCVINKLPGGGTAKELLAANYNICSLPTSYLKDGKINNILLSQTITLALNVNLKGTSELADFALQVGTLATAKPNGPCGTNVSIQRVCGKCENGVWIPTQNEYTYRTFIPSVITALNGNNTVGGLLDLANRALANVDKVKGKEGGANISDISKAVANINEIFDECRIPIGWNVQKCSEKPKVGCPVNSFAKFSVDNDVNNEIESTIGLKAYPNPFKEHLSFEMKTDVSTNVSLEVYNLLGQKVFDVFNGYLEAGTTKVVDLNNPYNGSQSVLIYVYRLGDKTYRGKLLLKQ
ncbi:MAG TPA: hypothetical protein VN192_04705 [Flavobacterium sp.]|nr:hypothetical protein [Flavobacterium sp.]